MLGQQGTPATWITEPSRLPEPGVHEKEGKEVESEMNSLGPGEAFFVQCDVTKESDIKNVIDQTFAAQIGQQGAVTYVATKGAITAMTKALAIDEAKYNVRVNSVSPGNVWTPMWEAGANSFSDPEAAKKAGADAQLIGRWYIRRKWFSFPLSGS
ncbi:unnamed protein product [Mytilus edulis]|uniref:Uncharacterized protein n=1 Tax=Mytilus edulis TaxID=6550 RepID=A0A8S3VGG9_MYTED|nr:unnamed protein product [Mytilus edulis]